MLGLPGVPSRMLGLVGGTTTAGTRTGPAAEAASLHLIVLRDRGNELVPGGFVDALARLSRAKRREPGESIFRTWRRSGPQILGARVAEGYVSAVVQQQAALYNVEALCGWTALRFWPDGSGICSLLNISKERSSSSPNEK